MMPASIKNLLRERKFGDVSNLLYEDPSLLAELARLLETSDLDTQTAILTIMGRYGLDEPQNAYASTGSIMAATVCSPMKAASTPQTTVMPKLIQ